MDWAIILAGGSGTRFWPLSSPSHPKQLLPLAGDRPTAVTTLEAIAPVVGRERVLLVTGPQLAERLRQATGLPAGQVLIEPRPASTAPALAWATTVIHDRDPEATILSMHADWHLADPDGFRRAARAALAAAREHDALITVGIRPSRTETGFGYIVPGGTVGGAVRRVERFREKPGREAAARLVAEGALWNSGLFAWTARRFLEEVRTHAPEVATALPLLAQEKVEQFFSSVQPIAVDVAVFERSGRVMTLPGDFPWDDVGAWDALARLRQPDAAGNVTVGPVAMHDCHDCIAWSDGTPIVVSGMANVIVVHANDRVLVLDRNRAADLKQTLDALPPGIRELP